MSRNAGMLGGSIPAPHPPHPHYCAASSARACRRRRDKAAPRGGNAPPCCDRRLPRKPCCRSDPLRHYGGAMLPVAASTTIVPVMCGCKEQKYLKMPGVVNVNENLSSLSSALDRKLLSETTVWGMSSSLVQVIVVPDLTFSSCGPKVKLPILIATSSAEAGTAIQTNMTAMPATQFVRSVALVIASSLAAVCR